MKTVFFRPLAFALCAALLAADLSASTESEQSKVKEEVSSGRRRAVTVDPNAIILTGTVTDAATGAPIFLAKITVGSRWGKSMRDGTFRITRGLAAGGASAAIERWGFDTETKNVALVPGTNTLNVKMTSKPVVLLTTRAGEVNRLDYETSYFSDLYPFVGLSSISSLEVCTLFGSKSNIEKNDIRIITFSTGQKVANSSCCANPTTGVVANITLKSGQQFDAMMVNSCTAYSMGFLGGNHLTNEMTNYPLSGIAKIEFP